MKNLICTLLLFTVFCAKAQVEPVAGNSKLRDIALSLDSFSTKVPVEKVHIHFDKPYYSLGDTIWMKVYVVNENNGLSPLSKILYTDLVDDKGQIKISLNLPLTKGLGWGAVTLNDSLLRAGNYHIRAYTTLMRNFGQEYFFDKILYIGNALPPSVTTPVPVQKTYNAALNKNEAKAIPDSAGISIKFFPEGGTLVNNLTSKIAFKAIGTDGLSREISGYVVDKDNQQLTTFKSEHAGMGAFSLEPAPNNSYTAVVKFKDGSEKHFKLPVAADKGYALSVVQVNDNIIVNIQASKKLLNTGEISLIAQANNTVQYTGKKELTRTGYTTVIPKSRFPEGIVQFTLFSPGYQPVAERLVFIHHAEQRLKVNIVSNKPDYDKRGRVHLDMEVTDQEGKPVTGAFSLAVTDGEQVPYTEADEKTIFSNLLLTSDLKGYIEQPNYYFTDINPDKDRQLDNLLLTQGWRRFIWKDILTNTLPNLAYQPEAGTGISGRILTGGGKPAAGAKVSMLLNVGEGMVIDTVSDAQGHFNFDKLPFSKNMAFNVSAVDAKGKKKNLKIEIDKKNATRPVFDPGEELSTFDRRPEVLAMIDDTAHNSGLKTYLQSTRERINELAKYDQANRPIGLKEVTIKENRADKIKQLALQDSRSLSGPPDDLLTFVDLADCDGPLSGCMLKHPAGMQINPNPNGSFSAIYERSLVPVLIEGKSSIDLASISPDQIAAIEFIKGARATIYKTFDGGTQPTTGIILITLKRPGVDYQKYVDEHEREKQKEMAQKKDEKDKAIALKEVTIHEQKEDKIKKMALEFSPSLSGPADQVLTFIDLADCHGNVGGCLVNKLGGVRITPSAMDGFSAMYEAAPMPIITSPDKTPLAGITGDMIASVEVIKGARAAVYQLKGAKSESGVILVTLKRGGIDYQKYIDEDKQEKQKALAQKKEEKDKAITLKNDEKDKAIALKEVTIRDKRNEKVKEIAFQYSDSRAGKGGADQELTFVDLANCANLGVCLAGKLTNVQVKYKGTYWRATYQANAVAVVVDGRIRTPPEYSVISPQDIAGIEVIKGARAGNLYGGNISGAIIITTKRGGEDYQKYIDEHDEEIENIIAQKKEEKQKAIALKEVTIEEKRINKIKEVAFQYSNSRAGKGGADQELTFVDLANCSNLGACLAEKLTNVQVKLHESSWAAYYQGSSTPMKVIVDGGAVNYSTITPDQIAGIEIIKGARSGNLYGGDITGAIIITTKKGGVDYNKYIEENNEALDKAAANKPIQLNEVEVIAQKMGARSVKDLAVKHSENLGGPGNADQVLTFIDLLGCQNSLAQCLEGRMTNVIIKGEDAFARGYKDPMYLIVDGIPGRGLNDVVSSDVSSVEILRGGGPAALYGSKASNGVIIVTTKKGDVDYEAFATEFRTPGYNKPKGLVTYKVQGGYDLRREFYAPDYNNPATDKQMPDLRSTIYWKPNIITDEQGKASVEFFNADGAGKYRVIAEGLDGVGKLGRQVYSYTVK